MDVNIRNILASELYSASTYFERICHAIITITGMEQHARARKAFSELYFDLTGLLENSFLKEEFVCQKIPSPMTFLGPKQIRDKVKNAGLMLENFLKLDFNIDSTIPLLVNFINLLYEYSYDLHLFCHERSDLEIQYPRLNILEMTESEDPKGLSRFYLNLENISEFKEAKADIVSSITWQRDKKYEKLLHEGHALIYNKKPDKALIKFEEAGRFKETAEILNLIGWSYSLVGKMEKAKAYSMKAINKDPNYGPPYNDLGSYLLSEGQLEESLKWFELAKRASNYQNREFPYINAGRAYMATQNFEKAMIEFNEAIIIAPYNDELMKTMDRIRKLMDKENQKKAEPIPPSVFE